MKELRYTLVTDGSSDRALLPILTWLLRENGFSEAIQPEWADISWLPFRGKMLLPKKVELRVCSTINLQFWGLSRLSDKA